MAELCKQRWWDLHSPYRYRNENLARMGFKSYRAYLKSDLWQTIRATVLAAVRVCAACGRRTATQVHHRSYDPATLDGTNLGALSAVCARCHRRGEKPHWRRQDTYERLMRMNKLAGRALKSATVRHPSGFIPDDVRERLVMMEKPKPSKPRRRPKMTTAFSQDMTPRLVKA